MTPKTTKSDARQTNRALIERSFDELQCERHGKNSVSFDRLSATFVHIQSTGECLLAPDWPHKITMRAVRQPLTFRRQQAGVFFAGYSLLRRHLFAISNARNHVNVALMFRLGPSLAPEPSALFPRRSPESYLLLVATYSEPVCGFFIGPGDADQGEWMSSSRF
jgi:hypothetical protein